MVQHSQSLPPDIGDTVTRALEEDRGGGDLTAGLIAEDAMAKAQVTVGMNAVLCGREWFDEVFRQLDTRIIINWNYFSENFSEIFFRKKECFFGVLFFYRSHAYFSD